MGAARRQAGRRQARATAHITQVQLGTQAPTLTPVPLRGPPDFSACLCSPELPMPYLCPRREPSPRRGPACLPCHQLRPGACRGPWCQACVTRWTGLTYPQQHQSYLEPAAGQAVPPTDLCCCPPTGSHTLPKAQTHCGCRDQGLPSEMDAGSLPPSPPQRLAWDVELLREAWELEAEPSAPLGDTVLPRGQRQAGSPWHLPDIASTHPRGGEAKDWPPPHPSTRLTADLRAEAPSAARTFLWGNREWAVRLRGPHTSRVDSSNRTEPGQSPCPLQAGALDHMAPTHCPPGCLPGGQCRWQGVEGPPTFPLTPPGQASTWGPHPVPPHVVQMGK